ncbi:MAG: hypothetical protein ABIP39_03835 [Polyangiaceae bacterium]
MKRVSISALFLVAIIGGCQGATGVTVEVSTDLPCESNKVVTTAITAGTPSDFESRTPSAVTTRCDSAGKIGSLVLVPSGASDAELAIDVTTALAGKDPKACRTDPSGCIVARRVLHYVPHEMQNVAVVMELACVGVPCGSTETCEGGRCVAAIVGPAVDADAGDDGGTSTVDAASPIDAAPSPCAATPNPGRGVCCGTSWCVGADCASLCPMCEDMSCKGHVCVEEFKMGMAKAKCAP